MSDLIDRAKAIEAIMDDPSDKYCAEEAVGCIEELPIVDAIPVHWLEDRASRLGIAEMDAVYRLIEEWKKENR